MKARKIIAAAFAVVLTVSQNVWVQADEGAEEAATEASDSLNAAETTDSSDNREEIETALNLANNEDQEWTYSETSDAWTLSIVDLNDDGDQDDTVALTIEYDLEAYPETYGYYGTYLNLYLAEFTANLQWYLDNLDYAEGWTWFDENGNALSDEEVASMTTAEKAQAFLEGRYAKGTIEDDLPDGMGGGGLPDGEKPDDLPEPAKLRWALM